MLIKTGSRAGPAHLFKVQPDRSWDTLRWLQAQLCLKVGRWVGSHLCVLKNLLPAIPFSRMRRQKPASSDIAATSQSPQLLVFFLKSQNLGENLDFFCPTCSNLGKLQGCLRLHFAELSRCQRTEILPYVRVLVSALLCCHCESLFLYIQ